MVLTAYFVPSPVTGRRPGFLATVAERDHPANLTPASGRQDHTILPSAAPRLRQEASPGLEPAEASAKAVNGARLAPPPRVRDDREPPL
jgi:hypothetical protein